MNGQPDAVSVLTRFVHTVRAAGMKVDFGRLAACVEAVAHVDWRSDEQVYWAMRVTLCSSPDDFAVFDQVFDVWFRRPRGGTDVPLNTAMPDLQPEGTPAPQDQLTLDRSLPSGEHLTPSATEVLRARDVETLTVAEREDLNQMISLLQPRTTDKPSRRSRSHRRGEIDVLRTVAQLHRHDGELSTMRFKRRRSRPRRLTFFIDVSGSMGWYADLMLRFAHAAVRAGPRNTIEVFTIGTRLSRVTQQLQNADPDRALTAASRSIPDWNGGTRLGESLRYFFADPQRACVRGAIVVLATDGGESGRVNQLSEQLERLGRLSRVLIWANPLADLPSAALTTPMSRLLAAYAKYEVPGNTLTAVTDLADLIADI